MSSSSTGPGTSPGSAPEVLGVPVQVTTFSGLQAGLIGAVEQHRPTVFVGLYAALFRALSRDERYLADVRRSMTYPDGQGVVTELRRRGVADVERMATTDIIHGVAELAARSGWRVGLFGAAAGVADRAARTLLGEQPHLQISQVWDGYGHGPSVLDLRQLRLDLLLVALGAGRQERWAFDVAVPAGVPAILTCGGLFDFLAGDSPRAPLWMQRASLEWAFRVGLEPRRLLLRYLLGNSYFLLRTRLKPFRPA